MLRTEIGMIFQDYALFAPLSVLRTMSLTPQPLRKLPRALLAKFRLAQADDGPSAPSGGQQRVAIARALATRGFLSTIRSIGAPDHA